MKGNKQKAEYLEMEGKHGKPGGTEVEEQGSRKVERRHPREQLRGKAGKKRKGRNRRLSSWKRKESGRKKANRKWKMPEVRAEGKHLWNSCGSESGKGERKHTESRVRGTGEEDMGN